MSVPAYQIAIIGTEGQTLRISSPKSIPIPTVKDNDDMVIVKTQAVALNPVDVKTGYSNFCTPNSISGCDFAGAVVAIGKNHEQRFNIGDRVCGVVHGMNPASPSIGAFAEYVCAIGNFLLKIPEDMSFEEAATFGTAIGTIGMALFWSMQLPASPTNPVDENTPQENGGRYVLVNGGSSASGLMAIQLLRLSGFKPLATCSPAKSDIVKSYGAEATFDYNTIDCSEQIRAYSKRSLRYTLDCITTPLSTALCLASVGRVKGRYTSLDPFGLSVNTRSSTIIKNWVLGPAVAGKKIMWPEPYNWDVVPGLREWANAWFSTAEDLIHNKRLKPCPYRADGKGFGDILLGLEKLRDKKSQGEKLVYSL